VGRSGRDGIGAICGVLGDRFGRLRRVGTGQTALSMVTAGRLETAVTVSNGDPWDRVGGVHMVEQAGGVVTDHRGDPWETEAGGSSRRTVPHTTNSWMPSPRSVRAGRRVPRGNPASRCSLRRTDSDVGGPPVTRRTAPSASERPAISYG